MSPFLVGTLFLLTSSFTPTTSTRLHLDPDETKSFSELITSHGYVLQEYHVLTADGYILTVHRVVPPDFDPLLYNILRKPVIAFHGILGDSACWYVNSPVEDAPDSCGDNLGFCMLKSGRYDLWAPNARGNRYSTGHLRYTPKDTEFWEFDWDHIARYDIPAFLELVREVTHHQTVGYIGFSQGGGTMFAFLSEHPQYASIIRPYIAWAPAVFVGNMISPMRTLLRAQSQTLPFTPGQHLLSRQLVNDLYQWALCRGLAGNAFCSAFTALTFGPTDSLNATRTPVYFHHFPSPCSNWQMAHFGQAVVSGRFAHFDYGSPERNFARYQSPVPPDYPLHQIPSSLQLVIMHGQTDWLVSEADTARLIAMLRTYGLRVIDHRIPKQKWCHNDFTNGIGAGRLVYDETIRYLDLMAWD